MTGSSVGRSSATETSVRRPSERRSVIFCAIGAVLGLAVAGAGLFSARGTRVEGVPPEDVAIVNQTPILMSDYVTQLRSLYNVSLSQATPTQKRAALDGMIREELYVERGVELGMQNDVIEVRNALVSSVEAQQEIDVNASVPAEDELRAFFARNSQKYQGEGMMTVTDYVAPSLDAAQSAVAAIRRGQPIVAAAAAAGLKSSGATDDGQEFYFAAAIHLGTHLFALAKPMKDGEVSDPAPDGGRVHVLAMQHNQPPTPVTYEMARDQVLFDFRADKITRVRAATDRYLRKRADVQIAKGFK